MSTWRVLKKILSDEGGTRILSGYLQHLWGWGYEQATVSILQIPGDESAGGVTYCRIRIEGKFGVTQILSTWDRMGLGKVRNHQWRHVRLFLKSLTFSKWHRCANLHDNTRHLYTIVAPDGCVSFLLEKNLTQQWHTFRGVPNNASKQQIWAVRSNQPEFELKSEEKNVRPLQSKRRRS